MAVLGGSTNGSIGGFHCNSRFSTVLQAPHVLMCPLQLPSIIIIHLLPLTCSITFRALLSAVCNACPILCFTPRLHMVIVSMVLQFSALFCLLTSACVSNYPQLFIAHNHILV